jgi:hypothetical protein
MARVRNGRIKNLLVIGLLTFGSVAHADYKTSCDVVLSGAKSATSIQIQTYLEDTLRGLEQMRGANGFLEDTVWIESLPNQSIKVHVLNGNTSPSNIAVDLLVQIDRVRNPNSKDVAYRKIDRVLNLLSQVRYHELTGLFFSRYSTEPEVAVTDFSVSSIDNFHLALALWTIGETFPETAIASKAQRLFARMDLSVFYHPDSGLIGGNLRHEHGRWTREQYSFAHFGSEARILYSAGWALGLFRKFPISKTSTRKAISALKLEVFNSPNGEILKLWDGAAFQLFFPKLFVGEENYSSSIGRIFESTADFMISEGERRHLPVPAAHSAGRIRVKDVDSTSDESAYRDKAGNLSLIASDNNDRRDPYLRKNWSATFAPNALMMASTTNPDKIIPLFANMMNMSSGSDRFYRAGMGFMDGLHVQESLLGEVVPVQLSLNQGVTALSLLAMASPDGMTASARALNKNKLVRSRLQYFYGQVEQKFAKEKQEK